MQGNPLKVYVGVKADFQKDGIMIPREITWEDGRRFEIDAVLDIRQAGHCARVVMATDIPFVWVDAAAFCFSSAATSRWATI